MLLKILRAVIICKMDNAGMGDELQNHFLSALGLREKKKSCVVLTPYFGDKRPLGTVRHEGNNYPQNSPQFDAKTGTEKEILTEGEYDLHHDWEVNSSSIFNKPKKLNKNVIPCEIFIKMGGVSV